MLPMPTFSCVGATQGTQESFAGSFHHVYLSVHILLDTLESLLRTRCATAPASHSLKHALMLKHTGAPVTHKRRAAERLGQENVMWRPQFAPQRSCNKRKADRVALISNVASPERLMPSTERRSASVLHGSSSSLLTMPVMAAAAAMEAEYSCAAGCGTGVHSSPQLRPKKQDKPRVVVLGSGWGSVSFIKSLPPQISKLYPSLIEELAAGSISAPLSLSEQYDVVLVSPRNFFLYTPLLPAVATGTMEERSIVEPVRNFVQGKAEFYQALAKDVDPVAKELVCCFPDDNGFPEACFKISYDVLVVSVGSVNNTFGIKGVESHCNFFKSIEDAKMLRNRVSECFERAALPVTSPEERKRLLSFVVVGGGPTGVEVAAELYDMIHDDLRKLYPSLIEDVQIRIIELMDHVLSTYDRAISIYTAEQFKRTGVQLVLNSRVASVGDGVVNVVDKANQVTEIKFGACVWATGVAMNPLVKQLQQKLEGQSHFRSIMTDEYLRVNGSGGSIWAIGDAATIDQPKALDFADSLFQQADLNHDERLSLSELRSLLSTASTQFSHLAEHASFLETKAGSSRWGGLVAKAVQGKSAGCWLEGLKGAESRRCKDSQQVSRGERSLPTPLTMGVLRACSAAPKSGPSASPLAELPESTELSREQFKELVKKIDSGLRALPATAQVAKQQGEYLATVFARNRITGDPATSVMSSSQGPFKYSHKGSAAYVGRDKAVFDVPQLGPLTGFTAGLIWKSFETYSQFSFRNQCLVASDWVRTKLFGRDISRV
ncbi:hypothetical protein QJQ45_000803 [Haematococcus lacustris]|nr:hypothetical protein QJQ45_000803 [Haematococcus lacustris]